MTVKIFKNHQKAVVNSKIESAVRELLEDYKSDKELTAFSSLDLESFLMQSSKTVVAACTQRSDACA